MFVVAAAGSLAWLWKSGVLKWSAFKKPRDVFQVHWMMWWLYVFIAMMAAGFGGSIGSLVSRYRGDGEAAQATGFLVSNVFLLGACVVALQIFRKEPGATPIRASLNPKPTTRDSLRGLGWLMLVFPISQAAAIIATVTYTRIKGHAPETLAHDTLKVIHESPWSSASLMLMFSAVILAPLTEEILFRALFQSALLRSIKSTWISVFISSACFAAIHFGGGVSAENAYALAPLFVLGLFLGIAFERTGRLWVPITMHMLFNAVNVALVLAMP